jgi:glucosamine-6-phosphate deaminase
MSIRQILKSKAIVCCVPDLRKAEAVRKTTQFPVSPEIPASIMRQHPSVWFYLDVDSASLITK